MTPRVLAWEQRKERTWVNGGKVTRWKETALWTASNDTYVNSAKGSCRLHRPHPIDDSLAIGEKHSSMNGILENTVGTCDLQWSRILVHGPSPELDQPNLEDLTRLAWNMIHEHSPDQMLRRMCGCCVCSRSMETTYDWLSHRSQELLTILQKATSGCTHPLNQAWNQSDKCSFASVSVRFAAFYFKI